jgi:Putative FMN-binding domain
MGEHVWPAAEAGSVERHKSGDRAHACNRSIGAALLRVGPHVRSAFCARRSPTRLASATQGMTAEVQTLSVVSPWYPWDAAAGPAEWQDWLAATDKFGVLAVNNLDPARVPLMLPLHFTVAGDELLMHLARPNRVWPHLEAAAEVRLAVTGDYAYIPTYWRAKAGGPDEDGAHAGRTRPVTHSQRSAYSHNCRLVRAKVTKGRPIYVADFVELILVDHTQIRLLAEVEAPSARADDTELSR